MPVYEYEHQAKACRLGRIFEVVQSIHEERLAACPECGGSVTRLISGAYVSTPTTASEYKSMGFTRLERRDEGVYENVTRTDGEARYMEAGKPNTIPDIKKRIRD
jgi:putative FmdB family regulatory protein